MIKLQDAIDAAVEWKAKAPENDWAIFDHVEGETELDNDIRDQCKLLACRIDRGAPAEMIQTAAVGLAALLRPAPEPAYEGTPAAPSVAHQIAIGAAVGLAGAVLVRSGVGRVIARQAVRQAAYQGIKGLLR